MQKCSGNHQTKDKSAILTSNDLLDLSAELHSQNSVQVEKNHVENEPLIPHQKIFDLSDFKRRVAKFNFGRKYLKLISEVEVVASGIHHLIIIKSLPGYGKTTITREILREKSLIEGLDFAVISGFITSKSLFKKLYEYRHRGKIVVFDDCDSVFDELKSANLLKAATDDKKVRRVCYETTVKNTDVPQEYNFEAGVILLTNSPLGKRNKALLDRGFFIELELSTQEKLQYIKEFIVSNDQYELEVLHRLSKEAQLHEINFSFRTFKKLLLRSKHLHDSLPDAIRDLRINKKEDSAKETLLKIMKNFPNEEKKWPSLFMTQTGLKERRFYDLKRGIKKDLGNPAQVPEITFEPHHLTKGK